MTKQEGWIAGLLGVGAVIVLYLLWVESQKASTPVTGGAVVPVSGAQAYPNLPVINLGNISIGAANPSQLYNTPLGEYMGGGFAVGSPQSDCGCPVDDCEGAGIITASPSIPLAVLTSGITNLRTFQSKLGGGATSAAPAFYSSGADDASGASVNFGATGGGDIAFG
jgi:hypothetical protein